MDFGTEWEREYRHLPFLGLQVGRHADDEPNKQRLKHMQKLRSKTLSLHHKSTLKKQGRHLWVGQQPVSKITALRWDSGIENSDSWSWVWFKPDLILYQKLDLSLFIQYSKNMQLPFKLQTHRPDFKCPLQEKKRALLNHCKVLGKCIVPPALLWLPFL